MGMRSESVYGLQAVSVAVLRASNSMYLARVSCFDEVGLDTTHRFL